MHPAGPDYLTDNPLQNLNSGLRTLDWTVDWTLDSIMDVIIRLEFRSSGVKGHTLTQRLSFHALDAGSGYECFTVALETNNT